jgi:hypothetical protein
MLGFPLDIWDHLGFAAIFALVIAGLALAVFVLGLPGWITISRKRPEADEVNVMGWAGSLAFVPWIKAFDWAFKPTDVVDIPYFPKQEQEDTNEQVDKLSYPMFRQN